MNHERRSGSTRTSLPMQVLHETRYLPREEMLRLLRNQPTTVWTAGSSPSTRPQRGGGAG